MSYEFKKLTEVEALTEVPENANALVEVDGEVKRVPWSDLGDSGGGGLFVVTLSYEGETIIADKTFAETYAAFKAGNMVVCDMPIGVAFCRSAVTFYNHDRGILGFSFTALMETSLLWQECHLNQDDSITESSGMIAVTSI